MLEFESRASCTIDWFNRFSLHHFASINDFSTSECKNILPIDWSFLSFQPLSPFYALTENVHKALFRHSSLRAAVFTLSIAVWWIDRIDGFDYITYGFVEVKSGFFWCFGSVSFTVLTSCDRCAFEETVAGCTKGDSKTAFMLFIHATSNIHPSQTLQQDALRVNSVTSISEAAPPFSDCLMLLWCDLHLWIH